ncbi:MAG: hypoxanthine phosphoribosyltransferase [Clostridia bacterium]|nr:hypoxanthine phosphoribosyltransferase [Clostridia bacterium]
MHQDVERILLTEEEVAGTIQKLADRLNADYQDKEVLCVCVLKGSVIVYSDLVRKFTFPVTFDFLIASSYESSSVSSHIVKIKKDLETDIKGKHVLIIEDIIDTGHTLFHLKNELLKREPASLKICTLLDKPSRREDPMEADYVGAVIPNEFVVGCGLDYDGRYRQFPYVGVLKRECYEK